MKLKTRCCCGCEINFTEKDIKNIERYNYQSNAYEIGQPNILNTTKKLNKKFLGFNTYDVFIDFEIKLEREEKISKYDNTYIQCPLCKNMQEEINNVIESIKNISIKKVTILNYKIISEDKFIGFKNCSESSHDKSEMNLEYEIDYGYDHYGYREYYYKYNLWDKIDINDIDTFTPVIKNLRSFEKERYLSNNISEKKYLELKKEFKNK